MTWAEDIARWWRIHISGDHPVTGCNPTETAKTLEETAKRLEHTIKLAPFEKTMSDIRRNGRS